MQKVEILSPAKVNFHLHVGETRSDGFHDILSLFQAVDLCDTIEGNLLQEKSVCTIEGNFSCPVEDNLIYKAYQLFRRKTGKDDGVAFRVNKRIPSEAGLGGGSSNAASALKVLTVLHGLEIPLKDMLEMAEELGSDVPFFFYGASAAVSGRGEVVESLEARKTFIMVLVKPESLSISTPEAYRLVDQWQESVSIKQPYISKEDMIDQFLYLSPSEWSYYNTFFETFKNQYKPLEFISNLLYDSGAVFTGLSGSGSALFGIFQKEENSVEAQQKLLEYFPFVERIISINSIPPAYVI